MAFGSVAGALTTHLVPRQNLIRSKNISISIISHRERLNTVREGNQEFIGRAARSLRQHLHIQGMH